ncbi:MerR family transcriptional regulator [Ectobacillus antri]|jgi:DNA-binding transcriptional MerR regulator|uniref:MerR family transcriptional regulator n=1 Tax=Ectobacillus antri TaxID=2486280 RepID=A0ABT6H075_9BACI|nr:MerR family transcriptional regulator [Ectobacillus antri]MDG4656071.1 MerR family transcriptional regulator [Ectobacillus antri]MDG5752746.1 MerR family transcriptional regulator [Ectobacillus antri]
MGTSGKYNIKAVSNMLGIQAGTLRAWERRYQIIAPKRNEAGHRLYTEEHVKILRWLLSKVNEGFTIGQAVSLLESNQLNTGLHEREDDRTEMLSEAILGALLQFDEVKAHEYLNEAFSIFSVDKVTIDVMAKVLVKIGDLWMAKKITSAHEHYATSFLRSRIGMIYHNLPVNTVLPKVIAVCGPGESHELGLLIFTIYLRRKGYQVIYLGASIDEEDIDIVIKEVQPKFLFLSSTMPHSVVSTVKLANRLREQYDYLSVGLGGIAFAFLPEQEKQALKPYLLGGTKEEWDKWMANA